MLRMDTEVKRESPVSNIMEQTGRERTEHPVREVAGQAVRDVAGHPVREVTEHPEYKILKERGFESDELCYITLLVYLDLIENKGWHDVSLCPVTALHRTVVTGHSRLTGDKQIILPSTMTSTLTMSQILHILDVSSTVFNINKVLLGFVDQDSTIVYYSLTSGLVPPPPPPSTLGAPDGAIPSSKRRTRHKNNASQFVCRDRSTAEGCGLTARSTSIN